MWSWSRTTSVYVATVVVTVLVGASYWFGTFDTLEAQLTDRFFAGAEPSSDIIIVDIDEASLATIGQWPWSRSTHADLLDQIGSARVVGFDVLFTEPSALGTEDDNTFLRSIVRFGGDVVLASVIDEQSDRLVRPIEILAAASQTGFVNTASDRDGVVRQAELYRGDEPSFELRLANTASSEVPAKTRTFFAGPVTTYTTLSYTDVLSGAVPAELFKDKTVLVGASAAGLGDTFQTPFGVMPGVEIHANTIDTVWNESYLIPLQPVASVLLLVLVALLVVLVVIRVTSARRTYVYLGIIFFGIIIDAYIAFSFGILVPHFYELLLFGLLTGVLLVLQYIYEQQEKLFIRKGFEYYVAEEVVAELQADPSRLSLGGETKELSILFSDIRGFTTISEQLSPQELMEQLNEYLEEMSEAVMQKQGLVDKYIGDAVMAFWGAPLTLSNHAQLACESVLNMMKALNTLNARWAKEGKPAFLIGVGVSTGDVVVGNMGSKRRFNYSIIGDEVNFSARIEGLTKQYGVACLIGEKTYQAIKDVEHLTTRELDDVMVKGKKEPRRIYQLVTDEVTDKTKQALENFKEGRAAYVRGDFGQAITHFTAALAVDPDDGPSRVFKERSEALVQAPPTEWNGVYEFTTK